jgi:hypothetical protein
MAPPPVRQRPRRNTKPVHYQDNDAVPVEGYEDDIVDSDGNVVVDDDDDEGEDFQNDTAAADEEEDGNDSESLGDVDSEEEEESVVPPTTTRPKRSSQRNKRKSSSSSEKEPARKSSRSTKYTNSMADAEDNSDLLLEEEEETASTERKKSSRKRSYGTNTSHGEDDNTDDDDDDNTAGDSDSEKKESKAKSQKSKSKSSVPGTPLKSPARRHKQKRRTIQEDDGYSDDEEDQEDYASDETEVEDGEEDEPLKVQRILASRTELRSKWKEICTQINTSEITNGSRWLQPSHKGDDNTANEDDDDTFEERFLVKWADLSYLHCSWETRSDLIDQVEGAKTYLSTFFKKSQDGYLFDADERNDGDYFDPAYTQIDRLLEVSWPDDVSPTGHDVEAQLKPEDVGVNLKNRDDEGGTGRQFLIKWGSQPYSDATYEFERDLIWNDVDYKPHVEAFLKRNKKPSKKERNQAIAAGKQELRRLLKVFRSNSGNEEEQEKSIQAFQKEMLDLEFKNGGQLRDYQAEGVAWMLSNYCQKRSSILADEMVRGFCSNNCQEDAAHCV